MSRERDSPEGERVSRDRDSPEAEGVGRERRRCSSPSEGESHGRSLLFGSGAGVAACSSAAALRLSHDDDVAKPGASLRTPHQSYHNNIKISEATRWGLCQRLELAIEFARINWGERVSREREPTAEGERVSRERRRCSSPSEGESHGRDPECVVEVRGRRPNLCSPRRPARASAPKLSHQYEKSQKRLSGGCTSDYRISDRVRS